MIKNPNLIFAGFTLFYDPKRLSCKMNFRNSHMKFCSYCGEKVIFKVPEGDNLKGHVVQVAGQFIMLIQK